VRVTCASEGVAARVGRVRQDAHLSHHTQAVMSPARELQVCTNLVCIRFWIEAGRSMEIRT
jgi:hypothetical protein